MLQKIERLNVNDFKEKLHTGLYTLLDIRTAQELITFGKISENQLHVDVYGVDAVDEIQKLSREEKYLVYCYHGNRSQQALQIMRELGFYEVYDLIGGIDAWRQN